MPKFVSKTITILLFLYSTIFTIFLSGVAVSRGFSPTNLITLFLFLPVTYYFVHEIFYQLKLATSHKSPDGLITSHFHLFRFLFQADFFYLLSLTLFLSALTLTFARQYQLFEVI